MTGGWLLVLLGMAAPSAAIACSCAEQDGWSIDRARADGAVFAEVTPLGERVEPVAASGALRVYTAAVRRAIGLVPGATIRIVTPAEEAACGVSLEAGEWQWLLLRPQPEGWGAELCAQPPVATVPDEEWDRRAGPPRD